MRCPSMTRPPARRRLSRKDVPNLLTSLRIVLGAFVFFALAAARGVAPFPGDPAVGVTAVWVWTALAAFVVAAATDYLDGYLARKWEVVSPWGAMLDPIADKIAVGAAILGLALSIPATAVPGFVILFREMFVSGLREGGAAKGVKFPVTQLAKWKTAIQLVALSIAILSLVAPGLVLAALLLLWVAAALTLWTGWGYAQAARKAFDGR